MCMFFSAISNGKGKVLFFTVEEIVKEMVKGNPDEYNWNSHTSIAHHNKLSSREEDKWNKWEYNPEKKEIKADSLVVTDDRKEVVKSIQAYLKDKDVVYMRNVYNRNSGDRNSGNSNSGDRNSGDGNSGTTIGSFCSHKKHFLFNIECSKEEHDEIYNLRLYNYFDICVFVWEDDMTDDEKEKHQEYKTIGGYLKTIEYKEAWKNVPKEVIEKIKKLKNFDGKVFEEITGLKV